MTLTLPFPPSVNTHWRHVLVNGKPRTLISKQGREYRRAIQHATRVRDPRAKPFWSTPRLAVTVDLHEPLQKSGKPSTKTRDVDNYAKPLLDALTHAHVWTDDSQIDELTVRRKEQVPGGKVVVRIQEIHYSPE